MQPNKLQETIEDLEWLEKYREQETARERRDMHMAENAYIRNVVKGFFFILFVLMALSATEAIANTPQLWMYLKQGAAGLDFYCTNTPPYADRQAMPESDYTPLALHPEDLTLYAQVVEVSFCNVDNLYEGNGNNPQGHAGEMFVWRFDHRVTDGNEANRHMTRDTAWIQLLDFGVETSNP